MTYLSSWGWVVWFVLLSLYLNIFVYISLSIYMSLSMRMSLSGSLSKCLCLSFNDVLILMGMGGLLLSFVFTSFGAGVWPLFDDVFRMFGYKLSIYICLYVYMSVFLSLYLNVFVFHLMTYLSSWGWVVWFSLLSLCLYVCLCSVCLCLYGLFICLSECPQMS